MKRWRTRGRALATAVPALAVALSTVALAAPAQAAAIRAPEIRGMNWADPRDNFVDGNLRLTGLSDSDDYATTYAKAEGIVAGLRTTTGANTVRLPINIDTVTGPYWQAYRGAIDAATAQGVNVMLAQWESIANRDGRADAGSDAMWDTVIQAYGSNEKVLFEIYNEPVGYTASEWLDYAASWISRYPSLPRGRIVVPGPYANDNAVDPGADPRFDGTMLSIHHYAFWQAPRTYEQWREQTREKVGQYAARTVFTEFGTFMTTGLDFNDPGDSRNEVAYLRAVTDEFRALGVGSVYWPGLRAGDNYALTDLVGSGTNLSVSLNNQSALDRIHHGWRYTGNTPGGGSTIVGVGSGRCLDNPAGNTANFTQFIIYDCNGGANQAFTRSPTGELRVNGKCVDASYQGTTDGTAVVIYDCNGGTNQQWILTSERTIRGVQSGLCLDVNQAATANGSPVQLYTCNGGANQRWTLT